MKRREFCGGLKAQIEATVLAFGLVAGAGLSAALPAAAQPALPDLAVSVQWSKFYVLIGSQLSFQVKVNNYGQVAVLANASVRVTLTNGTITGISTAGSGFTCPDANRDPREAVCRRDTPMAPGTAVTFLVGVQAPSQPGTITATATGSLPTSLPDRNPSNNSSTSYTQVLAVLKPDLTISVVMGPNPVTGGGPLLCTATVSNVGEGDAAGVRVTNMLPAGARFVKVEASPGFSCTHVSGVVTCTGAAIPARGSGAIYIDAQAPLQAGSLVYTAVVDPVAGETAAINNTASVTRANLGAPDLIPIASGTPWLVSSGGPPMSGHERGLLGVFTPNPNYKEFRGVTLHVNVKNQGSGPAPATNLRIQLLSVTAARFLREDEQCPLPYRFVDGACPLQDPSTPCGLSGGSVATCSIPELAGGAVSGQFVANVSVTISAANLPITFYVRADADGAVTESNENNNILPLTVTVP
jgi:uncharacterized repeat protein (TIGR01451 family)